MYERPEIVEVGQAELLTLGIIGPGVDKCECGQMPDSDPPQPGGGS